MIIDHVPTLHYALDMFGVVVFAATGALAAIRARMDFLGAMVLSFIVGTGGGTIRDVLLDRHPLGWVHNETLLFMPVLTGLAVYALVLAVGWRPVARHDDKASPLGRILIWSDAVGLSVFCVSGAQAALAEGASRTIAVVMAGITCAGGGILRDMMVNEVPLVLRGDLYMTPALIGATAYIGLVGPAGAPVATIVAFTTCLAIRAAAILFGFNPVRR